ncbi:hypothetical protein [Kitasatospora camelliae]|uniref:DUF732 domain-containing protein n=1 Tax=Kitasatospora camelliae TaxID=3156397 RepID=A0AAU8JT06_9ACTN
MRSHTLRPLLIAGLLAATLGLTACSSDGSPKASATPTADASATPTAGTSAAASPEPGATGAGGSSAAPSKPAPPTDAGLPAKPDAVAAKALTAALDAIDPEIVGGNPEQAVERARATCQMVYNFPKDRPKQVELTDQKFTSPQHPKGFGPEKAEKILAAVQAGLCGKI